MEELDKRKETKLEYIVAGLTLLFFFLFMGFMMFDFDTKTTGNAHTNSTAFSEESADYVTRKVSSGQREEESKKKDIESRVEAVDKEEAKEALIRKQAQEKALALKEKARLAEEARLEEVRLKEEARLAKEALIRKQAQEKALALKEEARLAKEALIRKQAQEKALALKEKARLAEEARLKEEARLAKEALIRKQAHEKALALKEKARLAEEARLAKEALSQKKEKVKVKQVVLDGQAIDEAREEEGIINDIKHNSLSPKAYILKGVYFKTGSATLDAKSERQLTAISKVLLVEKKVYIRLRGHTDSKGSVKLNNELSYKRALAVKMNLLKKGVERKRILVEGKGSSVAFMSNETEEGRFQNRRVDIAVISRIAP